MSYNWNRPPFNFNPLGGLGSRTAPTPPAEWQLISQLANAVRAEVETRTGWPASVGFVLARASANPVKDVSAPTPAPTAGAPGGSRQDELVLQYLAAPMGKFDLWANGPTKVPKNQPAGARFVHVGAFTVDEISKFSAEQLADQVSQKRGGWW